MDGTDINEIESRIPAQIKVVKSILAQKHNMELPDHCDEFVARCLRMAHCRTDKTIKAIVTYHEALTCAEEWGLVLKPSYHINYYKKRPMSLLRHRDPKGRLMFILRSTAWDPKVMSYDDIVSALWVLTEHCMIQYPELQTRGYVLIIDYKHYSWQQVWAVNQWRMYSMMKWLQNGLGGKSHELHIVNPPKTVAYLIKLVWPLMSEKSRKRIKIHANLDSLHSHVSPKNLPGDLGGMLTPEECYDDDSTFYEGLLGKDKFFEQYISDGIPSK